MLLFKRRGGAIFCGPPAVARGKKPGIRLSDSVAAEPETPRICSDISEEICFSSMERYN